MLLIKNAKLIGEDNLKDILISEDLITQIEEGINDDGIETIDAEGKFVLPGMVDVHTHMREPGFEHKEGFHTGSKACVKGGITTFIDMPNTNPATTTTDALKAKRKLAKKSSVVNYGFHFGASLDDNSEEIKKAKNVLSTKVFMNVSTGKMIIKDETILDNIFKASKMVSVHAEEEVVKTAIELAERNNTPLYVAHVSTKEEIEYIKDARKRGVVVYAEVTPHHLFLTEKDKSELNIMKPELRTAEDVKALWKAIEDGTIDTIGTDHAPHLLEEKKAKETFGVPGIETALPLMLNEVSKGNLSLKKLVKLYSKKPSKIFGISGKGKIKEGNYADLVIIDMNKEYKIKNKDIVSKCGWTPFDGWKVKGAVDITIVNGKVVYNHGKFYKNHGKEVTINE